MKHVVRVTLTLDAVDLAAILCATAKLIEAKKFAIAILNDTESLKQLHLIDDAGRRIHEELTSAIPGSELEAMLNEREKEYAK